MNKANCKQDGITIVEFSIISSVVLLLIFAILEVGMFVFNLQALNDLTRRTARIASVCQVYDSNIYDLAVIEGKPNDFLQENLVIDYLDIDGNSVENPEPENDHDKIKFVRVSIENYKYSFSGILDFLGDNGLVSAPFFETTLASESLGVERIDSDGNKSYTTCK